MSKPAHDSLSRRERQIMDVVYRRGRATAAEVQEGLADPPSYSAIRACSGSWRRRGICGTSRTARAMFFYRL